MQMPRTGKSAMVGAGEHPLIDHNRAVKKYHRPAAGNEAPLPEDVRPPKVLRKTMDYLLELLDTSIASFSDKHKFLRDRTRSIRQDIILQQRFIHQDPYSLLVVVRLHEEMARFHILSGHRLCELEFADFDPFQNTEQLRKVLQSLQEYYFDIRLMIRRGISHEALQEALVNESEFRAYQLLTHAEDQEVFRQSLSFPPEVFKTLDVQMALGFVSAFHQCDYVKYFKLVWRANYLQACLLQTHFIKLRQKALQIISKTFSKDPLPASLLTKWLLINDIEELSNLLDSKGSFRLVKGPDGSDLVTWNNEIDNETTTMSEEQAISVSVRSRISTLIESKVSNIRPSEIIRSPASLTTIQSLPTTRSLDLSMPALEDQSKTLQQIGDSLLSNLLHWYIFKEMSRAAREAIDREKIRRTQLKAATIDQVVENMWREYLIELSREACDWSLELEKQRVANEKFRVESISYLTGISANLLIEDIIRSECLYLAQSAINSVTNLSKHTAALSSSTLALTAKRSKLSLLSTPTQHPFTDDKTETLDSFLFGVESLARRLSKLVKTASHERLETKKLDDLISKALSS